MSVAALGICLALAAAPADPPVFVAAQRFTLAWTHSIEKVRWEERYEVRAAQTATQRRCWRSSARESEALAPAWSRPPTPFCAMAGTSMCQVCRRKAMCCWPDRSTFPTSTYALRKDAARLARGCRPTAASRVCRMRTRSRSGGTRIARGMTSTA